MDSPRALNAQASLIWLRRIARTTPGIVGMIAVAVAACCMIAGGVCASQLNDRIVASDAILDRSEPLAYSAQNLYAALSAADAAAASAFLSGGIETIPMRERYRQALADAAAALADTTEATDTDTRTTMAKLSAQVFAYTGLVESARANNRRGFPVGSGYLREGSTLMRTAVLPGAERIYSGKQARVDEDQRVAGSAPTAGILLLLLALATIIAASMILRTRTNRQFNIGLMVAAVAVLLAIVWMTAATRSVAGNIERSRTDGTTMFQHLAEARILAQQARTDETLQLLARGDIAASEASFNDHIRKLEERLPSAASTATADSVAKWEASHHDAVNAYDSGDYQRAVEKMIGTGPGSSATQFAVVESSLRSELEQARATLRDRVAAADARLTWSPTGMLLLMTVATVATVAGLWPRLKEFL